ncbi:MAG TPA: mannose-1-phosphate guanylyltransferase/mannose-6-phosphate isomerase [Methanocorpusculum sp.]|jgi:mannose-1-phosphate guanylyltransferase/mannose-6-phosphate isomerase|nr:mannose-1-phosphate guanylyltransferase/mannose-6-phosphate isomerase [Methanocorpusculum sp.]MEE1135369.1 mannose-1-phosphate guanylyltransferase/mannose-6-phosphate isomerase [Methanocorpusculum sp.]HJJ81410.1 mannose-1-phosphate guanylyltransferase/mannose-6-phosphate isomerase [Methanocorpusculum sp.]
MHTIILAGGSGTRLFPLSRKSYPKQFIDLLDGESLFQKSVKRALIHSKPEEIYIVTNEAHKFLVENQLLELKANCRIITEPCGKNTLPAIYYATQEISKEEPDALVLTLPSDQLITVDEAYHTAIQNAQELAKNNLVTFGIIPTTPHTGYGYIKPGEDLNGGYKVASFVEKPDLETAKKYLAEGYLWNAGIFCFSAKLFLDECAIHSPDICEAFTNPKDEAYNLTPKISIDYGLMEKTNKTAVVPLSSPWNDLGNFDALYSVHDKYERGNAVNAEYITPDGENNLVISNRLISTIGISNTAIIDTDDVLLVCPRSESQHVGEIAELLLKNNDERASVHTTVHRPWGTYTVLLRAGNYLIKRLFVSSQKRLSLQYHNHRSEHWVVVNGTAEVTNNGETFQLKKGESTFVPALALHRLANPYEEPLEVIEVQHGDILTEEDIIRCDDDFHRK